MQPVIIFALQNCDKNYVRKKNYERLHRNTSTPQYKCQVLSLLISFVGHGSEVSSQEANKASRIGLLGP